MRDIAERAGHGEAILVGSVGTGDWHVGDPPDRRSIAIAKVHGIDIANFRGRQIAAADFDAFDLILGMDGRNVCDLRAFMPAAAHKVHLFMNYALDRDDDVPDPYHETAEAFERLYQMLEAGCSSLLAKLERASWSGKTSSVR